MPKSKMKPFLHFILASVIGVIISFTGQTDTVMAEDDIFTITFHSGEAGEFEDGSKENTVSYAGHTSVQMTKVSHTENVDDTGKQLSSYGENWTNANIAGSDRGDTSKAHVVTLPGAESLTVDLYFNGEYYEYDWASVWAGSHPDYTASDYAAEGAVTQEMGAPNTDNRYGGSSLSGVTFGSYTVNGNNLTNMGHVTFTIPGDSVTFGFYSDYTGSGRGYGYYAVVSAFIDNTVSGEYKEPRGYNVGEDPYAFKEWYDNPELTGDPVDLETITSDTDLYAKYKRDVIAEGTWGSTGGCPWRIVGEHSGGVLEIGKDGQECRLPTTAGTRTASWPWHAYRSDILEVDIKGTVNSGSGLLYDMFYGLVNATKIDLTGFNTSEATSFRGVFAYCEKLTELNLGDNFDTSNATALDYLFQGCSSLTSLDLGDKFDTSKATTMHYMFQGCSSLTSLDLGDKFDTSNVERFSLTFADMKSLQSLDLGDKFDTSKATTMLSMFARCNSMTTLNLGDKFDTSNVTNFNSTFSGCTSLTALDLGDKFDTSKATEMPGMFGNMHSLVSLDLGDKFDTSNVTDMRAMFSECNSLVSLDLGDKFDTSKNKRFEWFFLNCRSLTSLNLGDKFDTSNGVRTQEMFSGCSSLVTLDLGDKFDLSKNEYGFQEFFLNCSSLVSLDLGDNFNTATEDRSSYSSMFKGCSSLKSLDLGDHFDTSNGYVFNGMFSGCSSLESLDLGENFDTSSGWDFKEMFSDCSSLTSLDLGDHFDTSNGDNFNSMFSGCSSLESLDLGANFNTSCSSDFSEMFKDCSSLPSLNLGAYFDTSRAYNLSQMFMNCSSLTSLDLGSLFTTKGVASYDSMFEGCSSIESLDLSLFDMTNMQSTTAMFDGMTNLKSIYLPDKFLFGNEEYVSQYDEVEYAYLPVPQSPSSGWVQYYDDHTQKIVKGTSEIYTPEELTAAWDPSSMSGLWIWNNSDPSAAGYGVSTKQHSIDPRWEVLDESTWVYVFDVFDDTIPFWVTEEPMEGFTSDIDPAKGYVEVINKKAEITNTTTRNRGDLTIRKIVAGGETDEKFNFTITLTGVGIKAEGTQVIDGVFFTNGVTHIQLGNGESKTIAGIPEGVEYTVTEDNIPGNYEMTSSNAAGTVVKEGNVVTFTNTKKDTHEDPEYSDLKLTKATRNADELDAGTEYAFEILFTNLDPNTTYEIQTDKADIHENMSMSFKSDATGKAHASIFLWDTETLTFKDLPKGAKYRITETAGDWVASYKIENADGNGTIAKDRDENLIKNTNLSTEMETVETSEQTTVTYTNTYVDAETIRIQKVVEGDENDTTQFEFHIAFTDISPNGTIMSSIGQITADEEGQAERDFYLSAGDEIVFEQIPVGTKYQITEAANIYKASYTVTDGSDTYLVKRIESASGSNDVTNRALSTAVETVNKGEDITVVFTNAKETGSLKVTKTGTDQIADDQEFTIGINLMGTRFPITGSFACTGTAAETIEFDKNGNANVVLKKGQSVTISGLPIGAVYTVEESDPENIYTKTYINETGTISAVTAEAEVNNALGGKIKVKKLVTGTLLGKSQEFSFTIELKENGQPFTGELETEGTDISSLTFDSNGRAAFTLKHNQELVIKAVPLDTAYTVTEQSYENQGYITSADNAAGTVTSGSDTNNVTFTNAKYIKLPNAASVTPIMFYGIGGLLILGGLVYGFARKKKKSFEKTKNEEETHA